MLLSTGSFDGSRLCKLDEKDGGSGFTVNHLDSGEEAETECRLEVDASRVVCHLTVIKPSNCEMAEFRQS